MSLATCRCCFDWHVCKPDPHNKPFTCARLSVQELLRRCGAVGGPINSALTGSSIQLLVGHGSSLAETFAQPGAVEGHKQPAAELLEAQLQTMSVCLLTGAHLAMHAIDPERVARWLAAMLALLTRLQAAPGAAAMKGALVGWSSRSG